MGKYNHLNFISVLFLDFFEYIITKNIIFSIIVLYIQIITILIRVI